MPYSEAEVIEQEIEQTRRRLDATLGNLQARATVAGIADEAAGMLAGTPAHSVGLKVLDVVRANPVPAALAVVGLSWLARQYLAREEKRSSRPVYGHPETGSVDPRGLYRDTCGDSGDAVQRSRAEPSAQAGRASQSTNIHSY